MLTPHDAVEGKAVKLTKPLRLVYKGKPISFIPNEHGEIAKAKVHKGTITCLHVLLRGIECECDPRWFNTAYPPSA